jgi:hypothetical protein
MKQNFSTTLAPRLMARNGPQKTTPRDPPQLSAYATVIHIIGDRLSAN